jgi:hypothetical protein
MSEGTFEGWAVLELMGHRKLAGKISEQAVGGGSMLRIDMYCGEEEKPTATQFYGVQSVYCLTPSTEELCRQYAAQCVPQPVARYELPAPCEPDNPIAARREDFDDVCANCGRHDCDDCEPESDDSDPCVFCSNICTTSCESCGVQVCDLHFTMLHDGAFCQTCKPKASDVVDAT